jgi:hypothetical protein
MMNDIMMLKDERIVRTFCIGEYGQLIDSSPLRTAHEKP